MFYLTLVVSDGTYNSTFSVNISIANVIHPPFPRQPTYNGSVAEQMPIGTSVVQVNFTSVSGNELTYSLSNSADFVIDASTGLIKTNRVFDYEVDSKVYTFTVFAFDLRNTPVLTGNVSVLVTLLPVNDERPVLNVSLIPGRVYYQQTSPIAFADVTVEDLDVFPIYYATVRIEDAGNTVSEALSVALPGNFKVAYVSATNTLTIVGVATTYEYSAFLSNVTYYNGADRLELPLERNILFSVCDQLPTSLASLSPDTLAALYGDRILSTTLSSSDAAILSASCLQFANGTVTLPLVRVNHRPVITTPTVAFSPILEDLPDLQNTGQPVVDVFGPAISDVDVTDPKGIAIVATSGTGEWEASQYNVQLVLNSQWISTVTLSISPLGVATFSRAPSSLINLTNAKLVFADGTAIDVTNFLISGSSFQATSLGVVNASLLLTSTLSLQATISGVVRAPESFNPAITSYVVLGNVSVTMATVVGPYSLLRFRPSLHWYGIATLSFYAWDRSNGLTPGTVGVDAGQSTAFSSSQGLATLAVTRVDYPPILNLTPTSRDYYTNYTENSSPVFVANDPTLEDIDSSTLTDLYVNITAIGGTCILPNYAGNSLDQLISVNISAMTSLIVTEGVTRIGQACTTYHYAGNLTLDQWRWFIAMLTFQVTNDEPSNHTRQLQFQIGGGSVFSSPASTYVAVYVISDQCPVVSLSLMTLSYSEHSGSLVIDAGLNVTDGDINPVLLRATVSLMDPLLCPNCTFRATQLPASIQQDTGNVLTLYGPASPEEFQAALRSVVFRDDDFEPSSLVLGVRLSVVDPKLVNCPSASGQVSIVIIPVDDFPPMIYLNSPYQNFTTQYNESASTEVAVTSNLVLITDKDYPISPSYQVVVQIVAGCVPLEDSLSFQSQSTLVRGYDSTTCSLMLQGNYSDLQNDLTKLRYSNVKGCNITDGVRLIKFEIYAMYLNSSTSSFTTVNVVRVNDPPIVHLSGSSSINSIVYLTDSATSVSLVPPGVTAGVTDCDSTTLSSLVFTITERTTAGYLVSPRSDISFESLQLSGPIAAGINVVPYNSATGVLSLTGTATLQEYSAALNAIVYSNTRVPPTNNRRLVSVVASTWQATGLSSVATVVVLNTTVPPVVDLNGENNFGINNQVNFMLTDPPVSIAPIANITDPRGYTICSASLVLTGPSPTCASSSLIFRIGFGDIRLNSKPLPDGVEYNLTTTSVDCRDAIIFERVIRTTGFSVSDASAAPGVCQVLVTVTNVLGVRNSEIPSVTVMVEKYDQAPFIDLDLGRTGRDYSTIYYQGGEPVHVVSILNEALKKNLTNLVPLGEAPGEAPSEDILGFTLTGEQSYAGYILEDLDSPNLEYLQLEFVYSTTLEYDVITYPCVPINASSALDPQGCTRTGQMVSESDLKCNDAFFGACASPVDLCSDLTVTIFCPGGGMKAYRFQYRTNTTVFRYYTLLGYLGYRYLLPTGGLINQIRLVNVTASDGTKINMQAITHIQIINRDIVIINEPVYPTPAFHVQENIPVTPRFIWPVHQVNVTNRNGSALDATEVELAAVNDTASIAFGITRIGGVVYPRIVLDREAVPYYYFTVTAHRIGAPAAVVAQKTLYIAVDDLNDNAPQVQHAYTINVYDSIPNRKVVQIVATDADVGINSEITYLPLGIGVEDFRVSSTGLVTTSRALNASLTNYYLIVVYISDRGTPPLTNYTVLNIHVVPVPATRLALNGSDITVLEDTQPGTTLETLYAYEYNGLQDLIDRAAVRYRLLAIVPSGGPFTINPTTGQFVLAGPLDAKAVSQYLVTIEAYSISPSSPPLPGNQTVIVSVILALPPVLYGSPYSGSVSESAPVGTVVMVINDTIAEGAGFVFSLTTTNVPFSVYANGSVVVSGQLNYETVQSYSLSIRVVYTPPVGMTQTSSAVVNINILDENDNAPYFSQNPYRASVPNTAQNGTVVVTIVTTDRDSPVNSQVTYAVTNTASTPFCQSGSTIIVCNSFLLHSWQQPLVFTFTVVATNYPAPGLTGVLTNTTQAIITLTLVNQYPPVFSPNYIVTPPYYEKHCNRSYIYNCSGVQVYQFSATDLDAYGPIHYVLVTPSVPFAVDSVTGLLTVTGTIDKAQAGNNYTLTVHAIDSPDSTGIVLTATATLVFPIIGIDDTSPTILAPFYFAVNGSRTADPSPFGQVSFADQDSSSTYTFFVSIPGTSLQNFGGCNVNGVTTSDPTYFPISISATTGQLSFCRPVDVLIDRLLYTFTVIITDFGYLDPVNTVTYTVQSNYTVEVTRSNTTVQKPLITVTSFTVLETAPVGTTVGNVNATGRPGAQLGYNLNTTCSSTQPFQVNATTGVLKTCLPLSYGVYIITITVCDLTAPPGVLCSTANLTVTVIDVNNQPPVFTAPNYYATILDTTAANQIILTVSATDADSPANAIVLYSILATGIPFSINRNTGDIFVSDATLLYRNRHMVYTLTVQAFNPSALGNDVNQTATTIATITVLDAVDITPVITSSTQWSIFENQPVGTLVGCITAIVGNNQPITYFIKDAAYPQVCTSYTPFRMNTTTGCFYSCAVFDYENTTAYSFGVVACSNGVCSNLTTITANISDLNDNRPVFGSDPIVVSLDENVSPGYLVAILATTDADSLSNSLVTYSFTNITTAPFAITSVSEVRYTGTPNQLNYNAVTSYILAVRATNPPQLVTDVTQYKDVVLIINIIPRNTFPPLFPRNSDTVILDEASAAGSVVYTLSTTDADFPLNSAVSYAITSPLSSPFAISGNNIVVFNATALPSSRAVQLTITATNTPDTPGDKVLATNFTLLINIVHAPVILSAHSYMLLENFTVFMMFFRISASNLDSGNFMYSIAHNVSGDPTCNETVPVDIDPVSGYLSLCRSLDYEMETYYEFDITVCTVNVIKKCTTFTFTLYVLDSNDFYPQIISLNNFTVIETAPIGTKIGCLYATDQDTGVNQILRYNFLTINCTSSNPFAMNQTGGCIYLCRPLDYMQISFYLLQISVCDIGYLCTFGNVSIEVQYANRYAPVINSSSVANAPEGIADTFVITVTAYDNDMPPYNQVTYSLLNNSQGAFYISPTNGSLYTARKLYRANQTVYYVGVVASDGYRNATQIITVFLIPSNTYPPIYLGNLTLYTLEENPFSVPLYFTDADSIIITYSVLTPGFSINQQGVLTSTSRLDRDPGTGGQPERTIEVVATGVGIPPFPSLSKSVNLTLVLIDINDNAPLALPPFTATILDGTKAGTALLSVNATDYDVGVNALLNFTLRGSKFVVGETTGVITSVTDLVLTSTTSDTFIVTLLISDHGAAPLSIAVNYTFYVVNSYPIFLSQNYIFSAPENSLGALAFTIQAVDRDLNPYNNFFNFSILYVVPYDTGFKVISINDTGYFYTPSDYFDYEDTTAFNIVVGVGRYNFTYMQVSNTTFVTLNVTEVNDNAPVLLFPVNLTGSIPDGAPVGYVATLAYALDYDSGVDGDVTFYFFGIGQQYFAFDASGNLHVSSIIPIGQFKNFTFTYFGCDNGSPRHCSENGTIFISVVNAAAPRFVPSYYTVSISENFGSNQAVLSVSVFDADTSLDEVVLSLSPPQPNFEIVQVTGTLMTTSVPLQRSITTYSFNVIAVDPTGLNGTASVVIIIDNTNGFKPYAIPLQSTVVFNESGPASYVAQGLSIVNILSPSVYPLTQVDVVIHTSPTDPNPYVFNGICDHANYSFLYNSNSFSLCNVNTCQYLLQTTSMTLYNVNATLQSGVLALKSGSYATSVASYTGSAFTTDFSISAWVLLQGTPLYVFQLVDSDVSYLALKADGSGLSVTNGTGQTLMAYPTTLVADGQWHHVTLVRENTQLILYLDGKEVVRGSTAYSLPATLNVRLGPSYSGQLSEVYLCSSGVGAQDVFCVYTCGETLDVPTSAPTTSVTVGPRAHSVTIKYSGPLSGGLSAIQTTLRYVRYYNNLLEPHPHPRGIFVSVYDSRYLSGPVAVLTLQIALDHDTNPVLDLNGLLNPGIDYYTTYHELSSGQALLSPDAALYDRDSGYFTMQKIEVNLYNGDATYESIFSVPGLLSPQLNIVTINSSSLTIISSDPTRGQYPGEFLGALKTLRYVNSRDPLILANRTITFKVYDNEGAYTNNPLSQTIMNMVHTDHPPVLDLNTNSPANYNVTQTLVKPMGYIQLLSDNTQSITDPDSSYIVEISVSLVTPTDGASEGVVVTGTLPPGVSLVQSSSDGRSLNITGVLSGGDALAALRQVSYANDVDNPSDLYTRIVRVTMADEGGAVSQPVYVIISVQQYSYPPILYLGGAGLQNYSVTFFEKGSCVQLVSQDAQIALVGGTPGVQTLTITAIGLNPAVTSLERIVYSGFNTFYSQGNLVILSFTQGQSVSNVLQELFKVQYCNFGLPTVLSRSISVKADSFGHVSPAGLPLNSASSILAYSSVAIQLVNDPPVLAVAAINSTSVRGVPTAFVQPVSLTDEDSTIFKQLRITIKNIQDGLSNELIQLVNPPLVTISIGPFINDAGQVYYNVSFQDPGANSTGALSTIGAIRYNNMAPNPTILPPRTICIEVADQLLLFSSASCVQVSIAPPNYYPPVFLNVSSSLRFSFNEGTLPVTVGTLIATDNDIGLAGQVTYSIASVKGVSPLGGVTSDYNPFSIDLNTGLLTAPNGMNAIQAVFFAIVVQAMDLGNPSLSSQVVVNVTVTDINSNAPLFTGFLPYVADPQSELLSPPRVIFTVTAVDKDLDRPNNLFTFALQNYQSKFAIDPMTGVITSTVQLMAIDQLSYNLNVTATDQGTPPLSSSTIVFFQLVDLNNYPAEANQLTPALYVVQPNRTSQSIGPAIRITDRDTSGSTISSVTVTLTPNSADAYTSYLQCLYICQNVRVQQAGLTNVAVDIYSLATFYGTYNNLTLGIANCSAVNLVKATLDVNDGYGKIPSSSLPPNFGNGDFSISFLLNITNEGYVFAVPNVYSATPITLNTAQLELALWVRKIDITFWYKYGNSVYTSVSNNAGTTDKFFNNMLRHVIVIVRSTTLEVYVDCALYFTAQLSGSVKANLQYGLFLGQPLPRPVVGGRMGGTLGGMYYYNRPLAATEISSFCSCGAETIQAPASLPTTMTTTAVTPLSFKLIPIQSVIPVSDVMKVLQQTAYLNTFYAPTFAPDRVLTFTVTELGGITSLLSTTTGSIRLVSSDTGLPSVDLNGLSVSGINYQTQFTEGLGAVPVASAGVRVLRTLPSGLGGTFANVTVQLLNTTDPSEYLTAWVSNVFITISGNNTGTLSVVGPGISTDFEAILGTMTYNNIKLTYAYPLTRTIAFAVSSTNGLSSSPLSYTTVTVYPVDNAPVLNATFSAVSFLEGGPAISIFTSVSISDLDNTTLSGAQVTLTSPNLAVDAISITASSAGIISSYNGASGVLSLVGTASLNAYQATLQSLQFVSTDNALLDNNGMPATNLARSLVITVNDGILNSNQIYTSVTFVPINSPPTVVIVNTTLVFTEGDSELKIAPTATIADVDNTVLHQMTVALIGAVDGDVLSDGSLNGTLLTYGNDLLVNYVTILRRVAYINRKSEPQLTTRIVVVTVCDFDITKCSVINLFIVVKDLNDQPPHFDQLAYTFAVPDNVSVGFSFGSLSSTDIDSAPTVFTAFIKAPVPFGIVSPQNGVFNLVTTSVLNYYVQPSFTFNIYVSDGLFNTSSTVTVTVVSTNSAPSIYFSQPASTLAVVGVPALLFGNTIINITDPDAGDQVLKAILTINSPSGSSSTLTFPGLGGYSFLSTGTNTYTLAASANVAVPLYRALGSILFVTSGSEISIELPRNVSVKVYDHKDLASSAAVVSITLISSPVFSRPVYNASLTEYITAPNFLQVSATVSGGPFTAVLVYSVESNPSITVDSNTGYLSLIHPLDHDTASLITLNVYAVESQPTSRTGTAVVNIQVLPQSQDVPEIQGLSTIILKSGVLTPLFPNITVSDPNTAASILTAVVTINSNTPLLTSPFSGQTCEDEPNALKKMSSVCHLSSYIELLQSVSPSATGASVTNDTYGNLFLNNQYGTGYTSVLSNLSSFEGLITSFTLAFWFKSIPGQSGFIFFYSKPDSTERYLAVYYDAAKNELHTTLKRVGYSGLQAQVIILYKLVSNAADGKYHFASFLYSARTLTCVVDGVLIKGSTVLYAQPPSGGSYSGETLVLKLHWYGALICEALLFITCNMDVK